MTIGPYTLTPIETGRFALDGGAMFGVVPKNLWNRTNPADEQNRIDMALRALLIQGDGMNILVDTGMGDKYDEKNRAIYKLDHTKFTLLASLAEKGLKPEDITHIIQTHLHFDHCGGMVFTNGGRVTNWCPNISLMQPSFIQREEFEMGAEPNR